MKKFWRFFLTILTFFILSIFFTFYFFYKEKNKRDNILDSLRIIVKNIPVVNVQEVTCPLCGEKTEKFYINRKPVCVMIENHPKARPQAGLDKACIVYEAPAEGGITRFMGVYLHKDAKKLGPVRSARPYFIDLALEYKGVYVFCGQSWEAFDKIHILNFPTINQMWRPQAFWREKKRKMPHNLYTKSSSLRKIIEEKGWELKLPPQNRFIFTEKIDKPEKPVKKVLISFPGGYKVSYFYDEEKKLYYRYICGKPHIDEVTSRQLFAKNIIIQYVNASVYDEVGRLIVGITGKGVCKIIRGGEEIEGKWFKKDEFSQTNYFDMKDNLIKFLPGNFWIEIVPLNTKVEIFP